MSLSVACRGEPSPAATPPGPSREAGRKGRPGRSASDPSGSTSIVFPRLGRIQRSRARAGSNCNGRAAHAEQPRHHAYRGLHLHQQVYLRYPGSWRRRRRPFSGAHSPSPAWRNALLGGGQLGGPVAGRPAASSPSSRSLLSIRSLKVLESSPSPRQRAAIFLPEAMRSPQSPCGTRARICSLGSAPMFAAPSLGGLWMGTDQGFASRGSLSDKRVQLRHRRAEGCRTVAVRGYRFQEGRGGPGCRAPVRPRTRTRRRGAGARSQNSPLRWTVSRHGQFDRVPAQLHVRNRRGAPEGGGAGMSGHAAPYGIALGATPRRSWSQRSR